MWGQAQTHPNTDRRVKTRTEVSSTRELAIVQRTESPSESLATLGSLGCDRDGNIYFATADPYDADSVHKLNSKGEKIASFRTDSQSELKIDLALNFAIGQDGDLYDLVFPKEANRYVFAYKADGTFKSSIKLDPGFPWQPSALAVFQQGTLLVSGMEYDRDHKNEAMWPFTGLFSSSGSLLKEIKFRDDEELHDLAASGDTRVTSATNPWANHAIEFSKMETGRDGNVYLMRWTNPAIFYVISPGGEVVRRFVVDPADTTFHPVTMHLSGSRIAVLFAQREREEALIQVVDTEGHEISRYRQSRSSGREKYGDLGLAFACYSDNPEQFSFLSSADNDRLSILVAAGR